MKTLREVIDPLVFAHILEVFRLGDTSPKDIPFGAVGSHNSKSSSFE
jgi:hypothetical protein